MTSLKGMCFIDLVKLNAIESKKPIDNICKVVEAFPSRRLEETTSVCFQILWMENASNT